MDCLLLPLGYLGSCRGWGEGSDKGRGRLIFGGSLYPSTQPSTGRCGLIPRLGKAATDICRVTKGEEEPKKKTAFTHENAWESFPDSLFFSGNFQGQKSLGLKAPRGDSSGPADMQKLLPCRVCVCVLGFSHPLNPTTSFLECGNGGLRDMTCLRSCHSTEIKEEMAQDFETKTASPAPQHRPLQLRGGHSHDGTATQ